MIDGGIFDPVSFELTGEAPVHADASLGLGGISGFREAIQEVGCCNPPPYLRNLLFHKLVQALLGVMGVSEPVPIDLELEEQD